MIQKKITLEMFSFLKEVLLIRKKKLKKNNYY